MISHGSVCHFRCNTSTLSASGKHSRRLCDESRRATRPTSLSRQGREEFICARECRFVWPMFPFAIAHSPSLLPGTSGSAFISSFLSSGPVVAKPHKRGYIKFALVLPRGGFRLEYRSSSHSSPSRSGLVRQPTPRLDPVVSSRRRTNDREITRNREPSMLLQFRGGDALRRRLPISPIFLCDVTKRSGRAKDRQKEREKQRARDIKAWRRVSLQFKAFDDEKLLSLIARSRNTSGSKPSRVCRRAGASREIL